MTYENFEPRSIGEHIDCLARLTGAPLSFVEQVRSLFVSKGISLDTEAGPFLPALEEAFRREESIRYTSARARENLARLQEGFKRVGKAYVSQLSQLKQIQRKLREKTRDRMLASGGKGPTHVTIRGDHRTFVTRPVREELPMVPGPKDLQ